MTRITPQQVAYIAELARLSLDEGESRAMQRDLERILEYVESLQDLDTRGVEATSHVIAFETPLRADRAAEAMDPELALANAPQRAGTAFVVPKVIDAEGP